MYSSFRRTILHRSPTKSTRLTTLRTLIYRRTYTCTSGGQAPTCIWFCSLSNHPVSQWPKKAMFCRSSSPPLLRMSPFPFASLRLLSSSARSSCPEMMCKSTKYIARTSRQSFNYSITASIYPRMEMSANRTQWNLVQVLKLRGQRF